jgi:hypothetical protein
MVVSGVLIVWHFLGGIIFQIPISFFHGMYELHRNF